MKKVRIYAMALAMAIAAEAGVASAATPSGFSSMTIAMSAQVSVACQEAQQGVFSSPLIIDTTSAVDQTISAAVDEAVKCTNGTVFTMKVSSANGSAANQTCTSAGVDGMAFKSTGAPADTIPYKFLCSGDTDGSGGFTGAGFGLPRAMGLGIRIAAADAQSAKAHDDYADLVTLTISY